MKKCKYVQESINEYWVSSNTGLDAYADPKIYQEYPQKVEKEEEESGISTADVRQIVPPSDQYHFSPNEFESFIDEIINVIMPESPLTALNVFKFTLKEHPYLMKRKIGFKGANPYEQSLEKFITTWNMVKNKNV